MEELMELLASLKPEIDFETENDGCVTTRDRDTMEQVRVKIEELENWIAKKIII